jgi:hypothetical protein
LSGVDPGHAENRNSVSTDVKASTAFIDLVKKKNSAHNATTQMHSLSSAANEQADVPTVTDDSTKISAMSCIPAQRRLKRNARKLAGTRMLAAAGRMVQYANEEFRRLKNHEQVEPGATNESAFARPKQNRIDAYTEIHRIHARFQELREVDLQLMAEEQAKEQNTMAGS